MLVSVGRSRPLGVIRSAQTSHFHRTLLVVAFHVDAHASQIGGRCMDNMFQRKTARASRAEHFFNHGNEPIEVS